MLRVVPEITECNFICIVLLIIFCRMTENCYFCNKNKKK